MKFKLSTAAAAILAASLVGSFAHAASDRDPNAKKETGKKKASSACCNDVQDQIQALKQEAVRLANERASLEIEEAQLVSPARMEQLAKEQQFIDPPAQKVVYLDTNRGGSLAMNK